MGSTTKSFQIIHAIVDAGQSGASFSDVVRESGVPKSTAHRLLGELNALGAVKFDSVSKTYIGGLLLARLGSAVASDYDLRRTVRPFLQQLHEKTGHTVTLGILDGAHGVYIDKIEPQDFGIRLHSEIGKAFPLHCTGIGKVLLAHLSASELKPILKGTLKSYTNRTITRVPDLRSALQEVRERGYAIDEQEITRGLVCIAAPVFGPDGTVAGALSCTFPTWVRDDHGISEQLDAVLSAASGASSTLDIA